MSKLSYIITGNGITAVVDGETMTITSDNPSYGQVLDAIKADEHPLRIAELFRAANAIKRYLLGKVEINESEGVITYQGEEINNVVVDRILQFMSEGLPVDPLIKFLEKLMLNPSRRAVQELYKFLEHKSLPLTEDGCFLAYKGVNNDYKDVHSGKFDNRVGAVNEMTRNLVCDDARVACSNGFHVGSLEYATSFGPVTVVCKVDPADVVSVPLDSGCQKLRTAKYEVVDEYRGAITQALVNSARPYETASYY